MFLRPHLEISEKIPKKTPRNDLSELIMNVFNKGDGSKNSYLR